MSFIETGRVRNFCFTWNNFPEDASKELESWDAPTYIVFQPEVGEEGTPHIQGYVEFAGPRGVKGIRKKFEGMYVMRRHKNSTADKASNYCKKGPTCKKFDPDCDACKSNTLFFEKGTISKQGARTDIEDISDMCQNGNSIREIILEHPGAIRMLNNVIKTKEIFMDDRNEMPKVIWLYGKAGVGKTKYVHDNHDSIYIKPHSKWWNGYNQQEVILIDDFPGFHGHFDIRYMFQLCDPYACSMETKGGTVAINSPYIYITCDRHWSKFFDTETDENMMAQWARRIFETREIGTEVPAQK